MTTAEYYQYFPSLVHSPAVNVAAGVPVLLSSLNRSRSSAVVARTLAVLGLSERGTEVGIHWEPAGQVPFRSLAPFLQG